VNIGELKSFKISLKYDYDEAYNILIMSLFCTVSAFTRTAGHTCAGGGRS
jgi:hypothetical protein